jgi:hypothetical protein
MEEQTKKCPFCKIGQVKRALAWRLVKDMSKKQIQEKIKLINFKKLINKKNE